MPIVVMKDCVYLPVKKMGHAMKALYVVLMDIVNLFPVILNVMEDFHV